MQIKDVGYELSIRLGDPVSEQSPTEDGAVFTSQEKLKYIKRAYSKLTRLLKILMRDYQPEFNNQLLIQEFNFTNTPSIKADVVSLPYVQEVKEVFIHYQKGTDTVKVAPADYMKMENYLSNKYGINDIKDTSFPLGKFKYTIISDPSSDYPFLKMLPVPVDTYSYVKAEIIYKPDVLPLGWSSYIPLTSQYADLLIDLAAIQGMQDIARADKAQLIERSMTQDWQILGQYGTYMKQTEGVKE